MPRKADGEKIDDRIVPHLGLWIGAGLAFAIFGLARIADRGPFESAFAARSLVGRPGQGRRGPRAAARGVVSAAVGPWLSPSARGLLGGRVVRLAFRPEGLTPAARSVPCRPGAGRSGRPRAPARRRRPAATRPGVAKSPTPGARPA